VPRLAAEPAGETFDRIDAIVIDFRFAPAEFDGKVARSVSCPAALGAQGGQSLDKNLPFVIGQASDCRVGAFRHWWSASPSSTPKNAFDHDERWILDTAGSTCCFGGKSWPPPVRWLALVAEVWQGIGLPTSSLSAHRADSSFLGPLY